MSAARMGRQWLAAALTLVGLGVFGVSPASAATLTVCQSGKPKCVFSSIQEAINAAKSGDTIRIAAGTYDEHLKIPGGGSATSLSLQGTAAGNTTISATNIAPAVVTIRSGELVAIKGVTITEGQGGDGGGIFNEGTLTVSNSTISGNRAENGAGIYNVGTLTVNNTTLASNDGGKFGGGIFNGGTATVNNSTIRNNTTGRGGGGIASDGKLTLNNSAVRNNVSNETGGGVFNRHGGTLTLNNSAISDNKANEGGGIFNEETVKGRNDSITGNTPNGITNALNEVTNEVGTTELKNSRVQKP